MTALERLRAHAAQVATDPQHHLLSLGLRPAEAAEIVAAVDAAAEHRARIAALEAENEKLREGLRPFARFYKSDQHDLSPAPDGMIAATFLGADKMPLAELRISDFRAANALLQGRGGAS